MAALSLGRLLCPFRSHQGPTSGLPPSTPPYQGSLTLSLILPHSLCWEMKAGGGVSSG